MRRASFISAIAGALVCLAAAGCDGIRPGDTRTQSRVQIEVQGSVPGVVTIGPVAVASTAPPMSTATGLITAPGPGCSPNSDC